jgi:hypothetical protein
MQPETRHTARIYDEKRQDSHTKKMAALTVPEYTPVRINPTGTPDTLKFIKDKKDVEYKISRLIYSRLHDRGRVEV